MCGSRYRQRGRIEYRLYVTVGIRRDRLWCVLAPVNDAYWNYESSPGYRRLPLVRLRAQSHRRAEFVDRSILHPTIIIVAIPDCDCRYALGEIGKLGKSSADRPRRAGCRAKFYELRVIHVRTAKPDHRESAQRKS